VESPTFPKRDPATAEFWDLRYAADFTPWEAHGVPRQLREYADSQPPAHVLVPGCGSARDVRFLAERGWDVLGIDFSGEAVAAACAILGSYGRHVAQADFFAPLAGEPFAAMYERAFLCALPRRLWPAWGERAASLVKVGGELAGFFFFDAGERGPPFPLRDEAELRGLLEPAFERVEDARVPDSLPVFEGRERWQRWLRR
jgi:SAM-dependent methyltransferase